MLLLIDVLHLLILSFDNKIDMEKVVFFSIAVDKWFALEINQA